jgi:hypothetical protein
VGESWAWKDSGRSVEEDLGRERSRQGSPQTSLAEYSGWCCGRSYPWKALQAARNVNLDASPGTNNGKIQATDENRVVRDPGAFHYDVTIGR